MKKVLGNGFALLLLKPSGVPAVGIFFHYSAIAQGCLALTLLFPSLRIGETL